MLEVGFLMGTGLLHTLQALEAAAAVGPLALAAVARRQACRQRVSDVLEDPAARYSKDHLLILCRQHNFARGTLLLLEKLEYYNDILEYVYHASAACRLPPDS